MNNIPVSWVGKLLQQLTHSAFLRLFDISAGIAFAEVLPVEADRDADFQDAVKNAAVIQIGSLLHNGKRDIRGDDHGLAGQQPLVNHIEYALLAETGVTLCTQIIQNEEVGAHKRFHVMVAIRAEITLHSIDHIGHSHKEDRLQTVNQSVGNTASGIGFSCANVPEQEQPDPRFLNSSQFCA